EWRKQVACADKLFLSKRDLCSPTQLEEIELWLADLAPLAEQCATDDAGSMLAGSSFPISLRSADAAPLSSLGHGHSRDYTTFAIIREKPVGWKVLHQSLE